MLLMWCYNLPRLRENLSQLTYPYKVIIENHSVTIEENPILKTVAYHSLPKYWMQKIQKSWKRNVRQLAPVYPVHIPTRWDELHCHTLRTKKAHTCFLLHVPRQVSNFPWTNNLYFNCMNYYVDKKKTRGWLFGSLLVDTTA